MLYFNHIAINILLCYIFDSGAKKMKIITFANNKGGTGKTSMSLAVSAELAKHGKTILIDADQQANAGSSLINTSNLDYQLADVLFGKIEIEKAIKPTKIENLYVITSNPMTQDLTDYINVNAPKEHLIFLNIKDVLELMKFDYVVFDTSPSFNIFEENILEATDIIFPVLLADKYSFDGLNRFRENLSLFWKHRRKTTPEIKDIILNQFDNRLTVSRTVKNAFIQNFGDYNCFVVPIDQTFRKCVSSFLTVQFFQNETKTETLDAIKQITKRILEWQ